MKTLLGAWTRLRKDNALTAALRGEKIEEEPEEDFEEEILKGLKDDLKEFKDVKGVEKVSFNTFRFDNDYFNQDYIYEF